MYIPAVAGIQICQRTTTLGGDRLPATQLKAQQTSIWKKLFFLSFLDLSLTIDGTGEIGNYEGGPYIISSSQLVFDSESWSGIGGALRNLSSFDFATHRPHQQMMESSSRPHRQGRTDRALVRFYSWPNDRHRTCFLLHCELMRQASAYPGDWPIKEGSAHPFAPFFLRILSRPSPKRIFP